MHDSNEAEWGARDDLRATLSGSPVEAALAVWRCRQALRIAEDARRRGQRSAAPVLRAALVYLPRMETRL